MCRERLMRHSEEAVQRSWLRALSQRPAAEPRKPFERRESAVARVVSAFGPATAAPGGKR